MVWQFNRGEQIKTADGSASWSARQHHDWQRDDFPAGYYSAEAAPATAPRTTLILSHADRMQPAVADVMLGDDRLIEVNEKGDVVWEWLAGDHIDEMGFAPDARAVIKAAAAFNKGRGSYDWLHVNSATYVGPNQWYDKGDARFAPNHVIISSREASIIAIIARNASIVWRMGPDFSASAELRAIRQSSGSTMYVSSRRGCRARETCSCSTTAARASMASPVRSRLRGAARSSGRARGCSRSTR